MDGLTMLTGPLLLGTNVPLGTMRREPGTQGSGGQQYGGLCTLSKDTASWFQVGNPFIFSRKIPTSFPFLFFVSFVFLLFAL